jgi:RNA polymerase sigma-70 factor (ECF subfamily)
LLKTTSYTEEELVNKLRLHDEHAFSYLYDNYSKALFTIISQFVPQQEAAEDLLQQVFVKIWKHISSYDDTKGRLFTWMLKITRNLAIDFVRSKEFNSAGKTVSLIESVHDKEVVGENVRDTGLKKILEQLPPDKRKLIELSYFTGYTQQEISELLGIPLGTIKTRLRNIIFELRKIMEVTK